MIIIIFFIEYLSGVNEPEDKEQEVSNYSTPMLINTSNLVVMNIVYSRKVNT